MTNKRNKTIEALINRHKEIQAIQKKFYAESDEIMGNLQKLLKPGEDNAYFLNGEVIILKDNFTDTNACFRTVSVRRFELDFKDEAKFRAKQATKAKKDG